MRAFVYRQDGCTEKDKLIEALAMVGVATLSGGAAKPCVLAFTGSGGKTTLIFQLAREAAAQGKKVFIATTTHMARPARYGALAADTGAIIAQMQRDNIVVAGLPAGDVKIGFIGQDVYEQVCTAADLVLVEADGSKRLPLKAFGDQEPVIPDNADAVLCIAGLSALGKPLQEVFFRLALTGEKAETVVTPALLGRLWQQGCLAQLPGKLAARPAGSQVIPVVPVLNQADTIALQETAVAIYKNERIATGLITCCL